MPGNAKNNERKILWIEDSYYGLKSLVVPLEHQGYRIISVTNEKDALLELEKEKFDLILFDIIIPSGSDNPDDFTDYVGVRLINEIVTVKCIKTPIIVLSVVNNPDVIKKFEDMGVQKILQKGYVLPSILKQEVENILGKI
jgi:CheY-like chemotaxis protein